jgi:hypothetical protein
MAGKGRKKGRRIKYIKYKGTRMASAIIIFLIVLMATGVHYCFALSTDNPPCAYITVSYS